MADQTTPVEPPISGNGTPDYGPSYFRDYWGGGGPYERNERWLEFFADVADGIVRELRPSSVLDAGCAMGFLVESLGERGVEAWGVDVSEYAIAQADASVRERCSVASLTAPIERRYDLITCIEVLEHVPPAETDRAVANLCGATDRLLLSTTPQDYGEPTHLNVQPPEFWSALLAREGFMRDLERDLSFVSPWAALYTRVEEPLPETVRRYDRAWARLRREATEVRGSLLATQERLAKLEQAGQAPGSEPDPRDEEILRLRDLLIGRDAELGAARGHLAKLEDQSQRVVGAAGRIQARLPLLARLANAVFRLLQSGRR
jgi:SAM-dependent methyltransferase